MNYKLYFFILSTIYTPFYPYSFYTFNICYHDLMYMLIILFDNLYKKVKNINAMWIFK